MSKNRKKHNQNASEGVAERSEKIRAEDIEHSRKMETADMEELVKSFSVVVRQEAERLVVQGQARWRLDPRI